MEITSDLIYKIVKEVLKETEGRDSNASDFVKETDRRNSRSDINR